MFDEISTGGLLSAGVVLEREGEQALDCAELNPTVALAALVALKEETERIDRVMKHYLAVDGRVRSGEQRGGTLELWRSQRMACRLGRNDGLGEIHLSHPPSSSRSRPSYSEEF
jgi:hypothetical protein